jgi:hypothetical protein
VTKKQSFVRLAPERQEVPGPQEFRQPVRSEIAENSKVNLQKRRIIAKMPRFLYLSASVLFCHKFTVYNSFKFIATPWACTIEPFTAIIVAVL